MPPGLVRFLQAMPEHGPEARQERVGSEQPYGYVTHQEISG